jgi:hypothetical protein
MAAAVSGAYEVVEYPKDEGRGLKTVSKGGELAMMPKVGRFVRVAAWPIFWVSHEMAQTLMESL